MLQIPYEKLDGETLLSNYIGAVESQDESSDPRGTVHDLLKGGVLLAPHFPYKRQHTPYVRIMDSWITVAQHVKHKPGWQEAGESLLDLEEALLVKSDNLLVSLRDVKERYDRGLSNASIRRQLDISDGTVKSKITLLRQGGLVANRKPSKWSNL